MGRSLASTVPCEICGDKSYGRHYGLWACDGCSCFFKRSVRRKIRYNCITGLNNCVVDRTRRNWCPACRLTKCYSLNMNALAVQRERGPRTYGITKDKGQRLATVMHVCNVALTSAWSSTVLAFCNREKKREILIRHSAPILTLFCAANEDIWNKLVPLKKINALDLDSEELRLSLCYLLCMIGTEDPNLTFASPLIGWYQFWMQMHSTSFKSCDRSLLITQTIHLILSNRADISLPPSIEISDILNSLP